MDYHHTVIHYDHLIDLASVNNLRNEERQLPGT